MTAPSFVFEAPSVTFRTAGIEAPSGLPAPAWSIPFAVRLAPWSRARRLGAYREATSWTTVVAGYVGGACLSLVVLAAINVGCHRTGARDPA